MGSLFQQRDDCHVCGLCWSIWLRPAGHSIGTMEAFSHLAFHLYYHNKTRLIKGMTASFTFDIALIIYRRRDRLPTPVFWPGKFHGLSYSPWGHRVRHDRVTFTFTFHFDRLFWHQVNSLDPGDLQVSALITICYSTLFWWFWLGI